MSVDYANNVTPASKRSPTQRHMHNYSLPSPFCAPRPTTPRPTRCRSSPALSEFRQAVYIQGPSDFRSAEETPPREEGALVVAPLKLSRKSPHTGGAAQFGTTCSPTTAALGPAGSDPGLHRVLSSSPPTSRSLTSTPSQRQKRAAHSPAFSYDSPPSYPSPRRPSTSPSRAVAVKLNRLSAASITSLPFPLPTPPGLGSNVEWEIDPFAAAPYYSPTGSPPSSSRWSSSTLSHAHHSQSSAGNGDQSTLEKFKGEKPSPTKLKELLGRLNINRNPVNSGFHFRSQSASTDGVAQEGISKRPDTAMIMDESAFIGEEEDPDITQNHETNVLGIPTIRPVSRVWATAKRGTIPLQLDPFFPSSSVDTHTLRTNTGNRAWNHSQVEPSTVFATSPTTTDTSPMSAQASIPKYIDGIAASHKSIIASVENPLYDCFRAPAPSLSSTMRTSTKAFASSSNLPRLNDLSPKPHSNQPRALAIPPSPRTPPPRPPNSLSPPTASESFLHFDFPSPPTPLSAGVTEMRQDIWPKSPSSRRVPHPFALAQTLPLQSQKPITVGDTFMLNEPPAIPPRSKLRPPPVKIPGPRRQAYRTKIEVSGQYSEYVSPTHSRSSSFTTFRTISPLPTPPIYSRSSSFAPFIDSPRPAAPLHSHSASVASSDFVISPMPTPPPLSPSEFSPSSPPWARPDTPEPRIDLDVLRALISQRGGPNLVGEPQSEGGMSLEAIARAHESSDDDLTTCGTTIPEFGFQEEPRAPPSRVSFYESPERVHTPSDIDDDAFSTYSHFSSTYYTFRRRSSSTRRKRSVRRNGSKGGRRRMTPVSMISVYSQASFCSQDAVDAPSVPILPAMTGDSIGGHEDLDENDLGEMVFEAPEYAYAFSWDDYVDHGLEGSALAGRSPVRSGSDFEAALFSRPNRREDSAVDSEIRPDDDWRALLTAQDKGKLKRRTSSNISVVENAVPIIQVPMATDMARPALTDVSSLATNGSISDISTTSTSPPRALLPNRRKRTIRTQIGTTVPYPSTPEYPPTTPRSGESSSAPNVMSTPVKPKGTTTETKSPLRGMKKRVSVFKSLVSFTLALPRSPSSPTFPPGPPPAPIPSVPAAPHASSWTPGHGLFLSPTATSSTIPVAI